MPAQAGGRCALGGLLGSFRLAASNSAQHLMAQAGQIRPQLTVQRNSAKEARDRFLLTRLDEDSAALKRYLLATMSRLRHERMIAFFGDAQGSVMAKETIAEGQSGSLTLSMHLLFSRALAFDCHRITLAHNHPSGTARPSLADIHLSKIIASRAKQFEMILADHFIVGRHNVLSMKRIGMF